MTKEQEVIVKAAEILKGKPGGLKAKDLKIELQKCLPSVKHNTIEGYVWKLDKISNGQISKLRRGFFVLKEYQSETNETVGLDSKDIEFHEDRDSISHLPEEPFYPKFAEYLKKIHECNKAVPSGSNRQGKKWENPDVMGWYSELTFASQQLVLVSGELKTSSRWDDIVTGFGQAASYLLFSHKSYLAIPRQTNQDDKRKIEALCVILGVGLLFFDNNNVDDPKFEVGNRPIRREPDIYFLTKRASEFKELLED